MRIVQRKVGRPCEWIHWRRASALREMGFSPGMMKGNKESLDRRINALTVRVWVNEIMRFQRKFVKAKGAAA